MESNQTTAPVLNRRRFIATTSLLGAGLVLAPRTLNAQNASVPSTEKKSANTINIAVVGCGEQGNALLNSINGIRNNPANEKIDFRLVALCDVWPRALKTNVARQKDVLSKATGVEKPELNGYATIEELLEKEKSLDAVFVATPDHWHARNTITALNAGKHVYCEKMMARTIDEGRQMVLASQKTGKLLQIGHQRRSNPNYRFAYTLLLNHFKFLGRINNANAQWNRAVSQSQDIELAPNAKKDITEEVLKASEFYADADGKPFSREDAIHRFRNWRWFKKYSNGPISDLGAHQIDIFNWVFGRPYSIMAAGGNDYYSSALTFPVEGKANSGNKPYRPREWFDNVMCIFDYKNIPGRAGQVARAYYQVLTTTSSGGGFFENFMGDLGSLKIAESEASIKAYAEANGKKLFDSLVARGCLTPDATPPPPKKVGAVEDARVSGAPPAFDLASRLKKLPHQPHVENFLRVVRDNPDNAPTKGETLNCDGEHAFQSEGPIFLINHAVEEQKRILVDDYDLGLEKKPGKIVI